MTQKPTRISVSLSDADLQKIKLLAAIDGISDSGYAAQILERAIRQMKVEEKAAEYGITNVAEMMRDVIGEAADEPIPLIPAKADETGAKVRHRRARLARGKARR